MAYTRPGETRERIWRHVRDQLLAGRPPTVREVQRHFRFRSVESARAHLEALVAEGRLTKEEGKARGYRLPGPAAPKVLVPLLGRVAAGGLQEAIEDPQGYLPIESRRPADELLALNVEGESMVGAGILPGDVVIVRRQPTAEPGEIVVALVDGEATVKRLVRRREQWVLMPENPAYTPIVPPQRDLRIIGKVIEVRRYLGDEGIPLLEP
ncbi:MAG: transcriptional repressor LexA [Thermoanaerobaculia bacterium]